MKVGEKFGTLTVLEYVGSTSGKGVLYRFRCDCGKDQVWYSYEVCTEGKIKICKHNGVTLNASLQG